MNRLKGLQKRPIALGLIFVLLAWLTAIYIVPILPFVPRSEADLKYSVIDSVGEPLVCTGWGIPNPRFNPYTEYPRIVSDVPTYSAIIRRQHLPPLPLTNDQIVAVYRDWLKLSSVRLHWQGGLYDFEMFPGPSPSEALRHEMVGKVDVLGHVYGVHQGPGLGGCPICLAAESVISTPTGPFGVSNIHPGMHVWSVAPDGRKVDAIVLKTAIRVAAPGSELVHILLVDGRELTASAPHELADGRSIGSLQAGDRVQGSLVVRIDVFDDSFGRTYDLLPSGITGEYWADGILLRSTLARRGWLIPPTVAAKPVIGRAEDPGSKSLHPRAS
jgi:hypothetical protein